MSDSVARTRLTEERRELSRNKPFGMYAKPIRKADGSVDLFEWECGILPKSGSVYTLPEAGDTYRVRLKFDADYPTKPPRAYFDPAVFHPNVFANGSVCLSILLEEGHHGGRVSSHWTPSVTISEILVGLKEFLEEPNPASVANGEAATLCGKDRPEFDKRVRAFAASYADLLKKKREEEKAAAAAATTTATATAAAAGK